MLFETNGPRFATGDASAATRRQRRSQTTSGAGEEVHQVVQSGAAPAKPQYRDVL